MGRWSILFTLSKFKLHRCNKISLYGLEVCEKGRLLYYFFLHLNLNMSSSKVDSSMQTEADEECKLSQKLARRLEEVKKEKAMLLSEVCKLP